MAASLRHRGPDDDGVFFQAETGIGLAFRRLSIIDLSSEGHQPMNSASGRYTIVFNGEIYNFEDIRSELESHPWRGRSDTEVMLAAIERWGLVAAVRRFVGMFALALWDGQEKKLFLVRDRLGIKPLYYGKAGEDFVFASELKAIHRYPGFNAEIDRDVVALYLRYNYVPWPHCIYKGFFKLPPGSILSISSPTETADVEHYWSALEVARAGQQSQFAGSDAEALEQVEEKLTQAIRLRMIADVPLGAFLSGGIDSSTVVALMQAQSTRPVKTFTIGNTVSDYDEASHAKKVAEHLGTEHTELYVTEKEALDVVPRLPEMYDEPFSDSSQIPTFLVSQLARQHVTVSLSGDGGDEVFGGYNRYLMTRRMWNTARWIPGPARRGSARMMQAMSPAYIDSAFGLLPRKLRPNTPADKLYKFAGLLRSNGPRDIYLRALSHWDNPADVVPGSHEPATVLNRIADACSLSTIEEAMMLSDTYNYLPDDILTKVDRATMAVSLEGRVPLLDHRVVEFAWSLPLRLKIRGGKSKWLLRQILYKHVPPELVERPKAGFGVPIHRWLRGALRPWAEELLSTKRLRDHDLFDSDTVQTKWREHLSGARNWQYLLWDVLIFQDWFFHNDCRAHEFGSAPSHSRQPQLFARAGSEPG